MNKKKKAILIVGIIILCCCVSVISFLAGKVIKTENAHDDGLLYAKSYTQNNGWIDVTSLKILCIPWSVEIGEQFDYILVDEFIIENGALMASPTYGFLFVNETTGKIQFGGWR